MSVPSTGAPAPPHPSLPLSPLPITTPSPALLPALSSGSGHPNSSTAGLSHQIYGVSWCQLKEPIRAAVCPWVWSQSEWEVRTSKRKSAYTDIHLFIVSSAGKLVLYFFISVKVRVMLTLKKKNLVIQFKVYASRMLWSSSEITGINNTFTKSGEWQEDRKRTWQRKRRNNWGNWEQEGL